MAKTKDTVAQILVASASVIVTSALLLLALALAGCGLVSSGVNLVITGNPHGIRVPSVGQWLSFGGGDPPIAGTMFSFPSSTSGQFMGYIYTAWPFKPQIGQTVTLTYDLIGNNPQWVQNPNNDPRDTNPPTISLFLWRKGDNMQCDLEGDQNYSQYRLFALHAPLVLGSGQSLTAVLDPSVWTGCYAAHSTPQEFNDLLNNLLGVGFTIGGQSFDGHGVAISGGSALFYIRGLTIN